jgi:hypothetical protein
MSIPTISNGRGATEFTQGVTTEKTRRFRTLCAAIVEEVERGSLSATEKAECVALIAETEAKVAAV